MRINRKLFSRFSFRIHLFFEARPRTLTPLIRLGERKAFHMLVGQLYLHRSRLTAWGPRRISTVIPTGSTRISATRGTLVLSGVGFAGVTVQFGGMRYRLYWCLVGTRIEEILRTPERKPLDHPQRQSVEKILREGLGVFQIMGCRMLIGRILYIGDSLRDLCRGTSLLRYRIPMLPCLFVFRKSTATSSRSTWGIMRRIPRRSGRVATKAVLRIIQAC